MTDEKEFPEYKEPESDIYLGIVVTINDTDIRLEPKSPVTDAKEKGIEYALPKNTSVKLGKLSNGIDDLLKAFGTDKKLPKEDELPDVPPLKWAYGKLVDASFSIDELHFKIPGTNDLKALQEKYGKEKVTEAPKKYTIALSANWEVDEDKPKDNTLFANVNLKSIFVMVSNEKEEEEEEKEKTEDENTEGAGEETNAENTEGAGEETNAKKPK